MTVRISLCYIIFNICTQNLNGSTKSCVILYSVQRKRSGQGSLSLTRNLFNDRSEEPETNPSQLGLLVVSQTTSYTKNPSGDEKLS